MILPFFRRNRRRAAIEALHDRLLAASRRPELYGALGVPDTLEGRFEALALHVVLMLRRLRRLPPPADDVGQDLIDRFFRGLDVSLREMGVGDQGVPKRMKSLAEAFYGRARAYDGALDAGDREALAGTLGRNALGSVEPAWGLADYVLAAETALSRADLAAILGEEGRFPLPPQLEERS